MILASAQFEPVDKNLEENIKIHCNYIQLAAQNNAQIIIFPEMSLSGYQREAASALAFFPNDSRLHRIRTLAAEKNIAVILGAAINIENKLYIGSFVILPENKEEIYIKQFLHSGEEIYFHSSNAYNPVISLNKEYFSFAVCADIEYEIHPANASEKKTNIYCASIFYTFEGMDHAHKLLSFYAKEYSMCVLMSNFCGVSYDLTAGGASGFWNEKGEIVAGMNKTENGILLIEQKKTGFSGKVIS